jgi:hypothetical protein
MHRDQARTWQSTSVPATCPAAVYAFAYREVVSEHVERVRKLAECGRTPANIDHALEGMVSASAAKADEVSMKIRAPLSPRQLRVYEDLDRMFASPGDLAILPRVFWLLGALAALAAVRASHADARSRSRVSRLRCIDLFSQSLHRHGEDAEERWAIQRRQIEGRHPWFGVTDKITLVGLESTSPRFVFDTQVRPWK